MEYLITWGIINQGYKWDNIEYLARITDYKLDLHFTKPTPIGANEEKDTHPSLQTGYFYPHL